MLLLAGIGALAWYFAVQRHREDDDHELPAKDPLLALDPTPSMRATLKYFWVVAALIVAQVGLGAVTAHYGVEGSGFYGIPLAKWLPYSVTRTWHTQLAHLLDRHRLAGHRAVHGPGRLGPRAEVPAAGRQLPVRLPADHRRRLDGRPVARPCSSGWATRPTSGSATRVTSTSTSGGSGRSSCPSACSSGWRMMARAMWPAFRQPDTNRHLLGLFLLASAAIPLFYAPGLMWHRHTNLAIAEYWRWWVVHLWVEGFFEVFATVVIAFLFTRMGLLRTATAAAAVLFSTTIFLSGGIIGTFHHLYFTGTPTVVMALGATFSALEVVPLVLIGFEAYENLTLSRARPWVAAYKWPIYFFVAVAFWNLVGAGLFGFLINPPIALYYMQGLNTTPVHGHTALFGVYGMLGIGLMLFCLKGLTVHQTWRTGQPGVRLLGDQHRAGADGAPEPAAGGADADLGERRARHLVRALGGVHADADDGHAALAAGGRRHDLRGGRPGPGLVRAGPEDRLVDRSGPGCRRPGIPSRPRRHESRDGQVAEVNGSVVDPRAPSRSGPVGATASGMVKGTTFSERSRDSIHEHELVGHEEGLAERHPGGGLAGEEGLGE